MKFIFIILFSFLTQTSWAQSDFQNPQKIQIIDYTLDAMEPFISRDNQYLFFNNSNDPKINTNLYYAKRISATVFQYMGEIKGVNSSALDGVASLDKANNFYFTSTREYLQNYTSIWNGKFKDGEVKNISPISSISKKQSEWINMDVEVNESGNTLYISDAIIKTGQFFPSHSDLNIAYDNKGRWEISPQSDRILHNINTKALEYAPSISTNGLELFFTRMRPAPFPGPLGILMGNFKIMYASRQHIDEPFGKPMPIKSITGFVEAPSISADGKTLYYHKREKNRFVLYKVTRE